MDAVARSYATFGQRKPIVARREKDGGIVLAGNHQLAAAHQRDRTAYAMELDPGYCDVICRRWQESTGEKPVAESTGNPHDFTVEGE